MNVYMTPTAYTPLFVFTHVGEREIRTIIIQVILLRYIKICRY